MVFCTVQPPSRLLSRRRIFRGSSPNLGPFVGLPNSIYGLIERTLQGTLILRSALVVAIVV